MRMSTCSLLVKVEIRSRTAAKTRIMVVDDHSIVRKQLRQVIQEREEWEVCGEASDGQEAIWQHSAPQPQVTVMDFNMPPVERAPRVAQPFVSFFAPPQELVVLLD
jgi:DNA-binding NarL/FixJ family response regulator